MTVSLAQLPRTFRASPGFCAVVILTLALGIGATTAVFSAWHAILLRPLPVREPAQLVALDMPLWFPGFSEPVSRRLYEQFRTRTTTLADLALASMDTAERPVRFHLGATEPVFARVQPVSGNFFATLGVAALHGRALTPADDREDGAGPAVAVISEACWRRHFARDPAVLGKSIVVENLPVTIVGVAAEGFHGPTIGEAIELWLPLRLAPQLDPGRAPPEPDDWLGLALARLRPGASLAAARAELDTLFQQDLARRAERVNLQNPELRRRFVGRTLDLYPAATGLRTRGSLRWQMAQPTGILLGAAGGLLLVAIANVAGLLLARGATRQRELAVRAALGAGRSRLARQLLGESAMLALAGGIAGIAFAFAGTAFLARFLPEGAAVDLAPDARVLGGALLLTFFAGIGCGLVPAWRLSRVDLSTALKNQGGALAGGRPHFQSALVVTQIALSGVLLAAAMMFGRSLHQLRTFDAGFARENVMTFTLKAGRDYTQGRGLPLYQRVLERVRALPGVRGATLSAQMPLVSSGAGTRFKITGYVPGPNEVLTANFLEIGPDFFAVLGNTLQRGRDFNAGDFAAGARPVAILGETMARHFFGGADPIGRQFTWGRQDVEIVGIARDLPSYDWVREKPRFTFYRPYTALDPNLDHVCFQVRTAREAQGVAPAIRAIVRELEPRAHVLELRTLEEAIDAKLPNERALAQFSAFFGIFAAALSALGLYGLLAYGVARRTREIGVRRALGAQVRDIAALILGQGLRLALLGCAGALAGIWALARLVAGLLYDVSPLDPVSLLGAAVALLALGAAACWIPARRALRVEPVMALRTE